jgi:hypothetical protein
MVTIIDQQYLVHVYAPTEGPSAEGAMRGLREIWRGCRMAFGMTEPVPGTGLPQVPPLDAGLTARGTDGALAAQERPAADCQAVLRRQQDVLNLSLAIAPGEAERPQDGQWGWWRMFDRQWTAMAADHARYMLGEARLFLARVPDPALAEPGLIDELCGLLPGSPPISRPVHARDVALDSRVKLWEPDQQPQDRALRRLVLAMSPDGDEIASAWAWSDGTSAIPPLARYLMHAAKLRYELRVWERDGQARELHHSLDLLSQELLRLHASDQARERLLRLRGHQAALLSSELGMLRRTVEIAADNLGRCFDRTALMAPGGVFADDDELGAVFLERLDDQLAYLDLRADAARHVLGIRSASAASPPAPSAAWPPGQPSQRTDGSGRAGDRDQDEDEKSRRVFVVHGRDEPARVAVSELLRSYGLDPVEWDEFVREAGEPMPFLGQVLEQSMPLVQAVVVVMTPDDIVRLHPDLHGTSEPSAETHDAMQARPNVLIELGMALAVHPKRTIMLVFGDHRPIADVGGRNYVRIADGTDFRARLGNRLILAGCPVSMPPGGRWRMAGDFSSLAAYRRGP